MAEKTKRTAEETLAAIRAMELDDALEETRAMSDEDVDRAIVAQGGDAKAIGERGAALAERLLARRERLSPWQEKAAARLAAAWERTKTAPKTPAGLPRTELLKRIEAARRDTRFDAPIAAAFRSRSAEESTEAELAALLEEIEKLMLLSDDDGDDE